MRSYKEGKWLKGAGGVWKDGWTQAGIGKASLGDTG